jgi:hypothetical protein
VASVRAEFVAYLRRTEGKLALIAVATVASATIVGAVGMLTVQSRQGMLDEAVDRGDTLTAAALDVYRTLADADATSLAAVLVDPQRAATLQQRYREDVFDAADALREAAARTPAGDSADQVRKLTDLLPEYARLVEIGWTNSRNNQPVGTSYLAQASYLVRSQILTTAEGLHRKQTAALEAAQRDAGQPAWVTFAAGALALAVLVAVQRYLVRRTRRRFNLGLVAATVLTAIALVWLGTALAVAASHADDSNHELDDLVAPLAQARNLGREADGDEARILIFPKVGDISRLRDSLAMIDDQIAKAGTHAALGDERGQIDRAAEALRSWRESDKTLLDQSSSPPSYQQIAALVTGTPTGHAESYAQQLDEHLTAAITQHTAHSVAATVSAKGALADLDLIFVGLMAAAAAATVAGLWPRITEYYR